MKLKAMVAFLGLVVSFALSAQSLGDIDNYIEVERAENAPDFFRADKVVRNPIRNDGLSMTVFLKKGDQLIPVVPFKVNISSGGSNVDFMTDGKAVSPEVCRKGGKNTFRGSYLFENKYFSIEKSNVYEFLFDLKCGESARFIFDHDSFSGEVISIFDIANAALEKFKKLSLDGFWNKKISIRWPGSGDYYSWGTVNVTKGYQWDVVGHEIGHAIYDLADIGRFGGGSHRIDQCYSDALALSEGWASFFSAWIKVKLNDPDASFEYMVPRRAPLKFENIPSDVCKGPKNEWRVTGFLWDIIDLNEDQGEQSKISFKRLWEMTLKKNFRSIKALADHLEVDGFDPVLLNIVWEQNFLTKR